ncbi:hypothetical protein CKO28_18865 [Rhodovibrio sodomensis]|uniref:Uncharacterized protein n=1 Tax=Rhodovibrio sodomensis TaxID=1088 RepID=A0ABS1DJD4_9PROT|nr:hypothetical protein [Rhodovibrio sodomensis]MBK1670101.1 hypothetical protein [Rhodovibrio sodomensis]
MTEITAQLAADLADRIMEAWGERGCEPWARSLDDQLCFHLVSDGKTWAYNDAVQAMGAVERAVFDARIVANAAFDLADRILDDLYELPIDNRVDKGDEITPTDFRKLFAYIDDMLGPAARAERDSGEAGDARYLLASAEHILRRRLGDVPEDSVAQPFV